VQQTLAVTALTLRTIPQRAWMSAAAVGSVALVVGVLLFFLAMGDGFRKTVGSTGQEDVAVFLRSGAGAEINSVISRDQVRLIEEAPGIARGEGGTPLVSAELYVIVDGIKRSTRTDVNLPLRGVGEQALAVRGPVSITEGRMFDSGANEIVVGAAVLREFAGFDLGQEVRLGTANWVVVGVFEAGGSVYESELWADATVIQNLYNRGTSYQSVRAKLTSPEALAELRAYNDDEPRLQLDVESEKDFFADQAGNLDYIAIFGWVLGSFMAVGALAGAWNTMYASADARTREIATLRAIGFSGFSAFVATLVESLILAAVGGVLGSIGAYLLFDGVSASTLGSGFTQVVFKFELGPGLVLAGVILALIVGFLGGFFPALRAARTPLLAVHQS
jgi:putative ABC transport system permease protein